MSIDIDFSIKKNWKCNKGNTKSVGKGGPVR